MPRFVPPLTGRKAERPRSGKSPNRDQLASSAVSSRTSPGDDPHRRWLREWRTLRAGMAGDQGFAKESRAAVADLQDKIAETPAKTLSGLQSQAELIVELAWNDVVARTARQLLAGLKRLNEQQARS